ncbi:MAG TPA: hypothetical protein VF677_01425, partial [Flavobacterium sp.]
MQNYSFISSNTIIFRFYEAIPAVHYIRTKSAGCRYHPTVWTHLFTNFILKTRLAMRRHFTAI